MCMTFKLYIGVELEQGLCLFSEAIQLFQVSYYI